MAYRLSGDQTRRLRLRAQRLIPQDARTPAGVARVVSDVCGVQAQDLPAARLSIRARSAGLTAAQVEEERQEKRSIAWTWCMRGTLHLVSAEDAAWLVPLLGPAFITADRRRMSQLGWDEERTAAGIRLLTEALAKGGGLTRLEIINLLKENSLPFEGQAPVHLLYRAALEGRLCAGPDRGKKASYVLFEDWLGKPKPLPRPAALAKIARRYLAAYAPARPEDLASWSGLKIGEARQAWKLIGGELVEVEVAGQPARMLKTQLPWLDELTYDPPLVRLLPRFDTYLLGYADRELAVESAYARRVHPGGGVVNAALLVNGRVLGMWRTSRRKGRLEVAVEPFAALPGELQPLIEAEVADLGRFIGEEVVLL